MLCQGYGNVHGSVQSVQDDRWKPTLPVLTPNLDEEDEDVVLLNCWLCDKNFHISEDFLLVSKRSRLETPDVSSVL